ncbi:MAG: M15 family metallopeptidase [Desulfobaccales bacterium]
MLSLKIIVIFLFYVFSCVGFPAGETPRFHKLANEGKINIQILRQVYPQIETDLSCLVEAYPAHIKATHVSSDNKVYVVMKNQKRILYDDLKPKEFEEKLNHPDLEDMLSQIYPAGQDLGVGEPDCDPGRFRVKEFFDSIYGGTPQEVNKNLVSVPFCGQRVSFNGQNRAAQALEKVGRELEGVLQRRPALRPYVLPLGGTYNWRHIAGTDRQSPHSWGIAVDLNPRHGLYWRSVGLKSGLEHLQTRKTYPMELIQIFENHGFIWGGRWWHFDVMHFEYRPELLLKARKGRARGFPEWPAPQ